MGGGSVAALSAALAAALLEKLVVQPRPAYRLRHVRRASLRLMEQDAVRFARVIAATRSGKRRTFANALKAATDVPCQVFEHAQAIQAACRWAQRSVKPKFQSDLRCAMATALAASESARTLIETNLAWLNDERYARIVHSRLQRAGRPRRSS